MTTKATDSLIQKIAEIGVQLSNFNVVVNRLDEIINGTSKSGGLKERIAIVEQEAKTNKESFKTLNDNITQLRNEMLVEVGNIAKEVKEFTKPKPLINWVNLLNAVLVSLAVGVVGVLFWKVIIPALAVNAP